MYRNKALNRCRLIASTDEYLIHYC